MYIYFHKPCHFPSLRRPLRPAMQRWAPSISPGRPFASSTQSFRAVQAAVALFYWEGVRKLRAAAANKSSIVFFFFFFRLVICFFLRGTLLVHNHRDQAFLSNRPDFLRTKVAYCKHLTLNIAYTLPKKTWLSVLCARPPIRSPLKP